MNSESDHECVKTVIKYRPRIHKLLGNRQAAEDCEQDIILKLLERSEKQPGWWAGIENKNAYIWKTVTFAAIDACKAIRRDHYSLDDEANRSLSFDKKLSDQGEEVTEMNRKIDYEPYRLRLVSLMEDFSDHERELITLHYVEGCKPKQIAKILELPYANVSVDLNRAMAKFSSRLKKMFVD